MDLLETIIKKKSIGIPLTIEPMKFQNEMVHIKVVGVKALRVDSFQKWKNPFNIVRNNKMKNRGSISCICPYLKTNILLSTQFGNQAINCLPKLKA